MKKEPAQDAFDEINKAKDAMYAQIKELILHFCGFALIPVEFKHIERLCKSSKLPAIRIKKLVAELVSEKRLMEMVAYRRTAYALNYYDYPSYFIPLSQAQQSLIDQAIRSNPSYFNDVNKVRQFLIDYHHNKSADITLDYIDESYHIVPLLANMFSVDPWSFKFNALNVERATSLLYELAYTLESGNNIGIAKPRLMRLMKEKSFPNVLRSVVKPMQYLFTGALQGKIDSVSQLEDCAASTYLFYAKALNHQYRGEISKALTYYQKGIKAAYDLPEFGFSNHNPRYFPKSPFYCLMYLAALAEDTRQSAGKKLEQIFKNEFNRLPVSSGVFLLHLLDKRKELDSLDEILACVPDMDFVLLVFILSHYKFKDATQAHRERAVAIIKEQGWELIQLEASLAFEEFTPQRDELAAKLGITPIFKPYQVLEEWEKQLASITKLLKSQTPAKAKTGGSKAAQDLGRIIYLIDDAENIHPILQKSKDGQTWTKGRNIALSSMAKGKTEFMSDVDKAVALTISCYDDWYGRSEYSLDKPKSFAALVNHPHLYLYKNPNISVQVLEEEPYLEIKSTAKEFKIASNVHPEDNETLVLKRESDVLYKVCKLSKMQRDILRLFNQSKSYPLAAKAQLTELINRLGSLITIHSDLLKDNKEIRNVKGSARVTVQILPMADGVKVELFSKPLEEQPPYFKAGKGMEVCLASDDKGQVNVTRDLKKERTNFNKARKILREVAEDKDVEDTLIFDEMYDCLELLDQLQGKDKELRIEWPKGAKLKLRGKADFKQLRLSAFSRGQWLEIDGDIQVDQDLQLSLAELLKRSRAHQGRFVELDHGEYLALSEKLRKKLAELDSSASQTKKGGIQISNFRSDLLGSLEEEGTSIQADKKYQELQKRIKAAFELDVQIPPTLTAQLRDYQVEGYEWLSRLAAWGAGACLADDMGLGKSVQSIAVMLDRAKLGASLIVAPASVVPNWRREIARFAPSLQCHLLHEQVEQREQIIDSAGAHDVVITTYGLLSRMNEDGLKKQWNVILLDEAHNIKNRETKCSKIAMSLQGQFRLALTGTPVQNHLGEIWNLFQFTNPGLLGSFEQFKDKFIFPIEKEKNRTRQQQLKRMIQPFLLRRTKSEVLDELPTKTEIIHHVELSAEERALYENIRQHALLSLEGGQLSPIQTLAELTKLRQAACHPQLIDDKLPLHSSAKVKRLLEIVEELIENKHSALIFSQFPSFLAKITPTLDALGIPYFYLDGQTAIKERERLVAEFQRGKAPLFLISLKAGGTGLNLTAADYVIHMDPWWNPAIEDQASDRSHRIGQTRPVTIYKLIAAQTIEERILQMHKNKKSLSDSLLEGGNMSAKLSNQEIIAMLHEHF